LLLVTVAVADVIGAVFSLLYIAVEPVHARAL
jgi:hypothetical protein